MTLVLPILNVERPAIIVSGYLKDFLNLHLVSGEIAIVFEDNGSYLHLLIRNLFITESNNE